MEIRWNSKWHRFAEPVKAKMLDFSREPSDKYILVHAIAWRICYVEDSQSSAAPKIEVIQYLDHFGTVVTPTEIHWKDEA